VDDEEDGNANKWELEAFLETLFGSSKNRMSKKAIDKALMHILLMVAVSLMKEEERRVFVKRVLDTTIKSSTGTGVCRERAPETEVVCPTQVRSPTKSEDEELTSAEQQMKTNNTMEDGIDRSMSGADPSEMTTCCIGEAFRIN
jgi:hypothetical protein